MPTQKKKILYLITKSNFGGAQRYVYDLAMSLPKNFEAVVAFGGQGRLKDMLDQAGIRTISLKRLSRDISILDEISVFFDLFFLFGRERPDVVHLNSSKIGGLGALAGRTNNLLSSILNIFLKAENYKLKSKIIFTAHGWAFLENRSYWEKKLIWFFSWVTALLCHNVITVSNTDFIKSPRLLQNEKKFRKIYNGLVPLEKNIPRSTAKTLFARQAEVKLPDSSYIVGTIAELHRNKGLYYLISAMGELREKAVLVIVGEGEERRSLEHRATELGIAGQIIFAGFIEDAARILPAFDIFVLPSLKEGLPYTLLEAGRAALPVVATSAGGIPDIIEDMKTGILVRPKQPKELASAISFLRNDKERAREFGTNLKQKIEKEFTLGKMVSETIEIYNS